VTVSKFSVKSVPGWLRDTPYWALAAGMHLLLFIVLLNILTATRVERQQAFSSVVLQPPSQPFRPRERKISHPAYAAPVKAPPSLDVEISLDAPKDPVNHESLLDPSVIGVGPGVRGRHTGRLKRQVSFAGDADGTRDALLAALEWLKRHQSADGSWKAHDFTEVCKKVCTNRDAERYGDGRGFKEHDVGVTGLAMLAFAGFGHTHQDGIYPEYVEVLKRAVKYLKSVGKKWNTAMKACLLRSQRRGSVDKSNGATEEHGSWDPIDEWGLAGGRVYATAIAAMTLEVYYRYER
jgi:hypothetical protein